MSGICGLVNFDGAPVDPELLRKMAEASAYRGPDGIRYWVQDNVGFAHLALNTTPESLREKQPLLNRRGDLILTADARVDNRDELISTLTAKGYLQEKDPTDADLILAAYECWGEACPEYIIGDFAFAIWDSQKRCLFCARDAVGVRPFFYCRRGQTLYFATAISSILAGLREHPPINEPLMVDFLCWRFDRWVHETIYQSIFRLPASHRLKAQQEEESLARCWTFGAQPGPHYKTDREYVEHFRELFSEAVQCRLRSVTPVGISVSGGLDSSSIACMADHILSAETRDSQQRVRLYSCVFKDFPAADEREYLKAVLDKCYRFPAATIAGENLWGLKDIGTDESFHLDEPEVFPIRSMLTSLLGEAYRHGCRVMLSGEGGDQVMSDAAYWMPALIRDVDLLQIRSELRHFWRRSGRSTVNMLILDLVKSFIESIKPCVPLYLLQRRSQISYLRSAPAWVNKWWIKPPDRLQLGSTSDYTIHLPNRSATVMYHQLTGGWYTALLGYINSVAAFQGMEYRLPFLDRRVIDFQLIIPPRLRFAGGRTKVILRGAMADILPETIRQRSTKAHFSEVVDYGLREKERAKVRSLLDGIMTDQGKYLDSNELRSAWQQYYKSTDLPPTRFLAAPLLRAWLQSAQPTFR
jgi:asparagine synthase (glutamine-hydrolysing)